MSYDALPVDQAKEKPASSFTQDMQKKVLRSLPFDDRRSFENASKGFIATLDPLTIKKTGWFSRSRLKQNLIFSTKRRHQR